MQVIKELLLALTHTHMQQESVKQNLIQLREYLSAGDLQNSTMLLDNLISMLEPERTPLMDERLALINLKLSELDVIMVRTDNNTQTIELVWSQSNYDDDEFIEDVTTLQIS